jgi:hypothetical protein
MKKVLTWLIILALVVGGGITVFWQINFFRLFDANFKPLVLTEAEAYCAGYWGIQHSFRQDDLDVADCIANSTMTTTPSIANAVRWSCNGIVAGGWPGEQVQCIDIFEAQQLWLLLEGGITLSWNEAHPRPRAITNGELAEEPRASTRTDTNRGDLGGGG